MSSVSVGDFGRQLQKILGLPEKDKRTAQNPSAPRILSQTGSVSFSYNMDLNQISNNKSNQETGNQVKLPDFCNLHTKDSHQCLCIYPENSDQLGDNPCGLDGVERELYSRAYTAYYKSHIKAFIRYSVSDLQERANDDESESSPFRYVNIVKSVVFGRGDTVEQGYITGVDNILAVIEQFEKLSERKLIALRNAVNNITFVRPRYNNQANRWIAFLPDRYLHNVSIPSQISSGKVYRERSIVRGNSGGYLYEYTPCNDDFTIVFAGKNCLFELEWLPFEMQPFRAYVAPEPPDCIPLLAKSGGLFVLCPYDARLPAILRNVPHDLVQGMVFYDENDNAVSIVWVKDRFVVGYLGYEIEMDSKFNVLNVLKQE